MSDERCEKCGRFVSYTHGRVVCDKVFCRLCAGGRGQSLADVYQEAREWLRNLPVADLPTAELDWPKDDGERRR